MPTKKKPSDTKPKKFFWRKGKKHWTNTLFPIELLRNPSRMTNHELVAALSEHMLWRSGKEKYDWVEDPIKEGAETEPPFSPNVVTNLLYEAMARLAIIGDAVSGRFKVDVKI
jgi:hypothetical protein